VVEQVRVGLQEWAQTHREASLAEHEQGVQTLWRRLAGPLLAAVVTEALGLEQPHQGRLRAACPDCGRRRKRHSWRQRELLSVWGPLRLCRPYYYCRSCRVGWCPADRQVDLAPYQELSEGLQGWLTLLGTLLPFRAAARVLEELSGVGVGKETVRTCTELAGQRLVDAATAAAQQVEASQEAAEPLERADGDLVVETDGVMVRYLDDWHEVRLALVAGCRVGPEPELLAASYVARRCSAAAFGPHLIAEAARRGALEIVGWEQPPETDARVRLGPALARLRPVIVLGDGARWIWSVAAEHFGQRVEIVDWYHATEHLWTLAKALWGVGTADTSAWVERAKTLLWEQGAPALLAELHSLRASTTVAAQDLTRERGYFATNAARMAYPTFRAQGLPVGSGAVESAAKHVVQQRLKRAGMRWSEAGGQALLALCARSASQRPLRPGLHVAA
jgi:hypothetical protein